MFPTFCTDMWSQCDMSNLSRVCDLQLSIRRWSSVTHVPAKFSFTRGKLGIASISSSGSLSNKHMLEISSSFRLRNTWQACSAKSGSTWIRTDDTASGSQYDKNLEKLLVNFSRYFGEGRDLRSSSDLCLYEKYIFLACFKFDNFFLSPGRLQSKSTMEWKGTFKELHSVGFTASLHVELQQARLWMSSLSHFLNISSSSSRGKSNNLNIMLWLSMWRKE